MARGNTAREGRSARSEVGGEATPSLAQRANQAIRNAPENADYLQGLQPFDYPYNVKNKDELESAIFDYLNNFDVLDADRKDRNDTPALAAFKKQVADALEDAKGNGSELISRGGPTSGYEQDEVWNGQGSSREYKSVLKAKGSPSVEITWSVRAYTDEDRDRGRSDFKAEINLKRVKIL